MVYKPLYTCTYGFAEYKERMRIGQWAYPYDDAETLEEMEFYIFKKGGEWYLLYEYYLYIPTRYEQKNMERFANGFMEWDVLLDACLLPLIQRTVNDEFGSFTGISVANPVEQVFLNGYRLKRFQYIEGAGAVPFFKDSHRDMAIFRQNSLWYLKYEYRIYALSDRIQVNINNFLDGDLYWEELVKNTLAVVIENHKFTFLKNFEGFNINCPVSLYINAGKVESVKYVNGPQKAVA